MGDGEADGGKNRQVWPGGGEVGDGAHGGSSYSSVSFCICLKFSIINVLNS